MRRFYFVVGFLFVLLLVFLDRQNGLGFIKNPLQAVLVPVQYGFYSFSQGVTSKLGVVFDAVNLHEENSKLKKENVDLVSEVTRLKLLTEENKVLKEQLGIGNLENASKEMILASVIGFGPIGQERYLLVDKGENEGVRRDSFVILRDILIGKVISTSPRSASIELLIDPNSKVPVTTVQKARGILTGRFQAEMSLSKVLPEEPLTEGDSVITSGEGGYPRGLVVGTVEKVKKDDKAIFQEAVVRPLVNYSRLSHVFIFK